MVYWYNSTSFLDDLSWAAGWMYRATLDGDYLADAQKFFQMHRGDVRTFSHGCQSSFTGCKLLLYPSRCCCRSPWTSP